MRFGPFEIERPLGRGGMAETFVAKRHGPEGFERRVCLKRILPEHALSASFVRAFQEEARLAVRLVHPHVVQVYDFGCFDGAWWMSLELVEGGDLRGLLDGLGQPLPVEVGVLLAVDLASALAYVHGLVVDGRAAHLVHRDLSPSNVLVDEQGNFKLADFGIAKSALSTSETTTGKVKGKACYMAPEQGMGRKLDARADLWALGVVLYEALSGGRPFDGPSDLATLLLVAEGKRRPIAEVAPHVPPDLCAVIERLLAVDPDARFPSAAAMLDALEARPPTPSARRRLAAMLRAVREAAGGDRKPPRTNESAGTLAVTALALEARPDDAPTPSAPDDPTRTRTVFDAALLRQMEGGAFEATVRHDAPASLPPPAPTSPAPPVATSRLPPSPAPTSTHTPTSPGPRTASGLVLGVIGVLIGLVVGAGAVVWAGRAHLPAEPPAAPPQVRAPDAAMDDDAETEPRSEEPTQSAVVAGPRGDPGGPETPETETPETETPETETPETETGTATAPEPSAVPVSAPTHEPMPDRVVVRDAPVEIVVVPWGQLTIDGEPVGRSPFRGRLSVGAHRVEAMAGELRTSRSFTVRGGARNRLLITLAE